MASQAAPPPRAQSNFTVVVPMAVQALVVAQDFDQTAAQFAPLVEPDYAALLQHPEAGAPVHDLMDNLDLSYWRMQARYSSRFVDPSTGKLRSDRCGTYLSWCLPRLYRAAITATDSALNATTEIQGEQMPQWDSLKARAGFKCKVAPEMQSAHDKAVQFRPAPDRWIIVRQVRGKLHLTKYFLVESNCVRKIDHVDMPEDFEAGTCPAMDPLKPIEDQPLLRMGRTSPLTTGTEKPAIDCEFREPFNAFELGHEFFADYAPHNMGVFSYFDNLDGIEDELVDYSVIGFHSSAKDSDPFTFVDAHKLLPLDPPAPESDEDPEPAWMSNKELLDALHLSIDQDSPSGANFALAAATTVGRTLTQGILRNVRWNRADSRSMHWPAASLQRAMYAEHPIAVGTHMLDALEAYLHIAMDMNPAAATTHSALGQLVMRIMAQQDNPDSLRKAAEDAASQSFLARPQGTAWTLPKDEAESVSRDALGGFIQKLEILNQGQLILDTCAREASQLMQCLFGCWWNAASLRNIPLDEQQLLRNRVQTEARKAEARLQELDDYARNTQGSVNDAKQDLEKLIGGGKTLNATPTTPFGQHQDPNVLVAGAKSGWPDKFNDTLPVRLAAQISPEASTAATPNEAWLESKFKDISRPVIPLLRELEAPSPTGAPNPYTAAEDMNNTQGWFPLFLEWELEYYHVPFQRWRFETDKDTGRWRYVLPASGQLSLPSDETVGKDMRVISGRASFLPEPGKSLRARLEQLFSQAPADGDQDKKRREAMLEAVSGLEYFSTGLSGLADHLVTLRRGHHPRPKANDGSGVDKILGIDAKTMELLEKSGPSELAPYGLSTPLTPSYTAEFSPFKPVTHGQARFTKFAIVDRFGQVISGIRLGPNGDGALYPSISPSLACGAIPALEGEDESEYWPNTVVQAEESQGLCQFFQIPPRINQHGRLNCCFLKPLSDADVKSSESPSVRQVASEWDNPVWAWVLPNFHNHSIQVYAPRGDFIVEMILGDKTVVASDGPSGATGHPSPTGRLPALLEALRDHEFCWSLFDMLAGASDSVLATGANFDSALPAALGRPFCIADVGVSIELSTPPLQDASLLSSAAPELQLGDYDFPVALGNHTAAFDGLVGTFSATGDIGKIATAYNRDARRLTSSSPGLMATRRPASEHPQPLRLRPYFLPGTLGGDLEKEHRKRLSAVSVIIDPKTPMHVYSGSLFPVASLSLPRWPVDDALRQLRAFFAVGPILVPAKPPPGDARIMALDPDGRSLGPTIQMPLGEGTSAWRWLQPRKEENKENGEIQTAWYDVAIVPLDRKLKIEAASECQLVEGFVVVKSGLGSGA